MDEYGGDDHEPDRTMTFVVTRHSDSRHASWWQICLLFALALLVFLVIRWQPEVWLQEEIDQLARSNGIDLHYQTLRLDGVSVHMVDVSVRTAELPGPVALDSLSIGPDWLSLLSGSVAVDAEIVLSGQSVKAVLVRQGQYIGVNDLDATLDMDVLLPLWQQYMPLPFNVGGQMSLSGNVQLDVLSGLPVAGKLGVIWHQARIDLPMFENKPLGDYQLVLKGGGKPPDIWQWTLNGGTELMLSGSGSLGLFGTMPQQWTINGNIQLQAASGAKAIAGMLGHHAARFMISGKLLKAHVQTM